MNSNQTHGAQAFAQGNSETCVATRQSEPLGSRRGAEAEVNSALGARGTPVQVYVHHPRADRYDGRTQRLFEACGYLGADRDAFLSGYSELLRVGPAGGRFVEFCCGQGALALEIAKAYPGQDVTAIDLFLPNCADADGSVRERPNLRFIKGSAFDLSAFEPSSVDMIWGQAALHHLASDSVRLMAEAHRVLRPGGKLIFIFEPLGHNWAVAAVRAIRTSKYEFIDESNLFFSQIRRMAEGFNRCEIQVFSLLSYPFKALPRRLRFLSDLVQEIDSALLRRFPRLLRYCANCNIIFTK
jgi:SAM-dependent methyltransferase